MFEWRFARTREFAFLDAVSRVLDIWSSVLLSTQTVSGDSDPGLDPGLGLCLCLW